MRSLFLTSTLVLICGLAGSAFAASPPSEKAAKETTETNKATFAEKLEDRLSDYETLETEIKVGDSEDKSVEKRVRIYKFKSGDDMREKSKDLEKMIVESGVLSNLADMIADFAEEVEVEKSENSFSFRFDGDTLGEVSRDNDDRVVLKSMDKEMTVKKESYTKDGKIRTRIIIDMEGDGSDVNLDEVLTKE